MTEKMKGYLPAPESQNRGAYARRVEQVAQMNVDETPMYQARSEEYQGFLNQTLEDLQPAEITRATADVQEQLLREGISDEESERLSVVKVLLDALLLVKASQNRQAILERLAKSKYFDLGVVERGAPVNDQKVSNALYQLSIAATNLAQAKFPEEVRRQQAMHDERNAAKTKEMRDELMNKKVS